MLRRATASVQMAGAVVRHRIGSARAMVSRTVGDSIEEPETSAEYEAWPHDGIELTTRTGTSTSSSNSSSVATGSAHERCKVKSLPASAPRRA